jgi:hypothetical protein
MRQVNASTSVRVVLSLLLLAAVASSRASAAPKAAAVEYNMFCLTPTAPVFYVSDIFDAGRPAPGPRGRQGAQIAQLFVAFLQKKYGATAADHALCGGPFPTTQAAQENKQQLEESAKKDNKKIVETGWKKE